MPQAVKEPHFLLTLPGEEFEPRLLILPEGETRIGRSLENDVVVKDSAVSRTHSRVIRSGSKVIFEDLGDRTFGVVLQIATLTRTVEVDGRYGTWDPMVGRMVPPEGPR